MKTPVQLTTKSLGIDDLKVGDRVRVIKKLKYSHNENQYKKIGTVVKIDPKDTGPLKVACEFTAYMGEVWFAPEQLALLATD